MIININGIETHYAKEGSSSLPILILPGWGANSSVYTIISKQLSQKYTVYSLDLPGFGITSEPPISWTIDDYADFVTAFINELQLKELILIGHSYGGRIIINLCNRRSNPFTIKEVVLIDSAGIKNPLTKEQEKRQKSFKKLKAFYSNSIVSSIFPKALEKLQKKYGSSDYANASPVMKETLVKAVTQDYTDLLPNITQKVFLIWGKEDTATPITDAYKMKELIPDSELEIIENAGHFPFLDQPFAFRKIINNHFKISL